jgi:hypothetical protein
MQAIFMRPIRETQQLLRRHARAHATLGGSPGADGIDGSSRRHHDTAARL